MKKIITGLLLTSSFLVSAAAPEFTEKQLQQVAELRTNASSSDLSYQLLESLTTEVGPRLPGTENDKKAVAWAQAKFKELGFDKVWLEEATFPEWRRFSE
ncbi:peptidase M28 family protein, partial [Pseudoalteromonas sp. S1727]